MKLLVISAAYPPLRAGESEYALLLCQALANAGLQLEILTNKGATDGSHPSIVLHPIMSKWDWSELPRMTRLVRSCAPDAVLLLYSGWLYKDHPMITFCSTLTKRIFPRVRFVTNLPIDRGAVIDDSAILPRLVRKAVKHLAGPKDVDWEFGTLYRDSDAVIVFNNKHRDTVAKLVPGAIGKTTLLPPPPLLRLTSLPHAQARKLGRERLGIEDDQVLLAFFGYVYPRKGIDVLLRALNELSAQRDDLRLVFIGGTADDNSQQLGTYANEMRNLAEQLGISNKVIWSGEYQSGSDFASVSLLAADACVLPFDEGVTMNRSSLAAAVAHGLPTISTRGETLEPQFLDRKNVLLCPVRDHSALAACIDELINNPTLKDELRKGAREFACEWFSWDKALRVTIAALQS